MNSLRDLDADLVRSMISVSEPRHLLFLAEDLASLGQTDLAEMLLVSAADSGVPEALLERAVLANRQGRLGDALDLATRARDAGVAGALITIGNALDEMGRAAEASEAFEQAIREGVVEGYANLGLLLQRDGKRGLAEDCFREGWLAGDGLAGRNLGVMLLEDRRLDEAQEVLRAAASVEPDAWFDLGNCYNEMRDSARAASAFESGASVGDFRCHLALADLLAANLEDTSRAEAQYRAAIRAGDHLAYRNFGLYLLDQDRPSEAVRYLSVAGVLGDGAAWHELATLALQDNRREQAVRLLKLAVAAGDEDAQATLDDQSDQE